MPTESHTSRRLFLAAGPAAAVFGALSQAAAKEADPIFAAIERHEAAEVRYCAACKLTDEVAARNEGRIIMTEDRAEFDAAQRNSEEALDAFLATTPTTAAGVRAFLRHCIDEESVEEFLAAALETLLDSPILNV